MPGFKIQIVAFLFLISVISTPSFCTESTNQVNSTFQPTHEWQKVEEGQSIPAGLHVRVNLQTGEKEAKFAEEDASNKKSLLPILDEEKEKIFDPDELKKLIKNIKGDDPASDSVKNKFRSYEELKKEFSELNLLVKTDVEIITSLVENFKKFDLSKKDSEIEEEVLTILVDLEYLVHQYDNAQEFVKMNGLTDIVYKSLNSTNADIRSEALRLHGSATQSNPKVQIAAVDSGSINLLLKILAFDEDANVRSRSLYALSCLLRRFPIAQHKLIKDGGLSVFAKIFEGEKEDLIKLQVKIVTLLHDLLFERKDTKMNILEEEGKNLTKSNVEELKERLRQYESMDLEKKLAEQDWCKRISNWFMKLNSVKEVLESKSELRINLSEQHDVIEKVVDTLFVLSDICKTDFQMDENFLILLDDLMKVYDELGKVEGTEEEDGQFYSSIASILKMLNGKLKDNVKDEL